MSRPRELPPIGERNRARSRSRSRSRSRRASSADSFSGDEDSFMDALDDEERVSRLSRRSSRRSRSRSRSRAHSRASSRGSGADSDALSGMTDDEDRRSRAHSRRSHRSHRSRSRSLADASDADSGDAKPRISRRERDAMAERRRSMADEVLGLGPEAPAPSLSRRSSRRMRDEPEPAFFDAEPPSAEMERRGRSADRRGRSAERRGRSSDRRGRSSDRRGRSSDRRERSAERRGRSRERRDRSREPARDMAADRAKEHAVQRFRPDSLAEAQEPREKIRDVPREPREASGRRREPERRREANGDAAVAAAVPPSMADPGRKAGRPASIMSRRSIFSSFSKLSAMSESSNINAEEVQLSLIHI